MTAHYPDYMSESSTPSSPVMSDSDNGEFSPPKLVSPEAGWAEPAVANQQPTCEAGMWSPQNPSGTPLQGWDGDKGDLFAFAHFNSICTACEKVVRRSLPVEQSQCTSPAFLFARDRGKIGDAADRFICCNRPARERCFALEFLATLVQEEGWTLRGGPDRQADYLDCLRFYLNQQFLKLVEQGNVLQCYDETGRALWICFCTGLLSKKEESIFCVFQRNSGNAIEIAAPWLFSCFATARELREPKQLWNALEPIVNLPDKATFFDDHLDLVYAPSGHYENIQLESEVWDGLDGYLPYFPKSLVKSGVTSQVQKQGVMSALQRAFHMLQYNPFTAVPQFFRPSFQDSGCVQLLLPIKLDPDVDATHLALVLETTKSRRGGRMYRATGLTTLQQAYANARVLMPVSQRWLRSCVFSSELTSLSKGYYGEKQSRVTMERPPQLAFEPKPRTNLSAPASSNVDENFARTWFPCNGMTENRLPTSRSFTVSQKGGSLPSFFSFHTAPDGSSPISHLAPAFEAFTPSYGLPVMTMIPVSHHQVPSPPNPLAKGNTTRRVLTLADMYGERKPCKGTGVSFPIYADALPSSSAAFSARLPSCDESKPVCDDKSDHTHFQGLSMSDKGPQKAPESSQVTSKGGESTKQTFGTPTMTDLGGHTWGVSALGPSLCPAITSETKVGNLSSANDGQVSLGFIPGKTLSHEFIPQLKPSAANCEMSRIAPPGPFPLQVTRSTMDFSAISGDAEGLKPGPDEYAEYTPADDACPKLNIAQLPPRFVADFLSGDGSRNEKGAELHTTQAFGRYGAVARSLIRENKNHTGKWFAIVEFTYWTDEAARLQLIQGSQVRFPDFYGHEDVVFRRHKDKQKKSLPSTTTSPSSCRPFWKYTGTDTRAGKPLFKGPCSQCGKESTVPFKPVLNGPPPRCRNCLPFGAVIPATMAAGLMVGQQALAFQQNFPFTFAE